MATATAAGWTARIIDEIFVPERQRAMAHPFMQDIVAGRAPKDKLLRMLGDVCWIIISFPEYIASFASRCPKYDHGFKAKLLENAYEERNHPMLLAEAITALGGDGDAILNDPNLAYQPLMWAWHQRNWIEVCAFHKPWVEGLAGVAVGVEAIVPHVFTPIHQALLRHYGLPKERDMWFQIHAGEVEMSHGDQGLQVLERYVAADDKLTQARCYQAVERAVKHHGTIFLDQYAA